MMVREGLHLRIGWRKIQREPVLFLQLDALFYFLAVEQDSVLCSLENFANVLVAPAQHRCPHKPHPKRVEKKSRPLSLLPCAEKDQFLQVFCHWDCTRYFPFASLSEVNRQNWTTPRPLGKSIAKFSFILQSGAVARSPLHVVYLSKPASMTLLFHFFILGPLLKI